MAAMSERLTVIAFHPRSSGMVQSRRKWMPSPLSPSPPCIHAPLSMAVVATVIVPGVGNHVEASSPIPLP